MCSSGGAKPTRRWRPTHSCKLLVDGDSNTIPVRQFRTDGRPFVCESGVRAGRRRESKAEKESDGKYASLFPQTDADNVPCAKCTASRRPNVRVCERYENGVGVRYTYLVAHAYSFPRPPPRFPRVLRTNCGESEGLKLYSVEGPIAASTVCCVLVKCFPQHKGATRQVRPRE
ncbi:hypothetical protein B0H16DRAFT_344978 [Mycena metata]|uniref:Uncharacterized protein n=1 Tax=Mycena metata TaxID=1033252 RepID=A0AAD7HL38_9AGAR|nr:hypothetical protein B0H16DRAFT_344978 [Mycena metata]